MAGETNKQTDLVLHVGDGVPDNVATSNYLDELTPSQSILSANRQTDHQIFYYLCLEISMVHSHW